MVEGSGVLQIHVSHAHDLARESPELPPNPFVEVTFAEHRERTATVESSMHPQFGWDIHFRVSNLFEAPLSAINFDVLHAPSDTSEQESLLGAATLDLAHYQHSLSASELVSCTLQLKNVQYIPGKLSVAVRWVPDRRNPVPELPPPPIPTINRVPARIISFDRRQKTTLTPTKEDIKRTNGILLVHVKRAVGLEVAGKGNRVDSYVKVKAGTCVEQTCTIRGTTEPVFDWEIQFRFANVRKAPTSQLHFAVCDWHRPGYEPPLGTAVLELEEHCENLAAGGRLTCTLQLTDGNQVVIGELVVGFFWEPSDGMRYYPRAVLPPPLPPKPPTPRRKTSGYLRAHLSSVRGLRTTSGHPRKDYDLTTFMIKVTLGGRTQKCSVVKDSRDPDFDHEFSFRFDHVLVATAGSLCFEILNWDRVGWHDPLGIAIVGLEQHREFLAAREQVKLDMTVDDGQDLPAQLVGHLTWEYDEPPTPRPLAKPVAEPEAEPSPRLMTALLVGVPLVTGYLSWDAEYNSAALMIAIGMPCIAMIAYLVTPLTPPEDPSEPPMVSLEDVVPTQVAALIMAPINMIYTVKDWVMDNTVGALMRLIGPTMAPYLPHVAYGIQLSMGVSAMVTAEQGFLHIHRFGAGLILTIQTLIQVPDSMAVFIDKFPRLQEPIDAFNEKKRHVESAVSTAADDLMMQVQEVMEDAKDANPGLQDQLSLPPYAKPYYRYVCEMLDGIGQTARASPFKMLVVILELAVQANELALPTWEDVVATIPDLPSWSQVMSVITAVSVFFSDAPTAWPVYVVADHGTLRNATNCQPLEPCRALGAVVEGKCAASHAWFPSKPDAAKQGITMVYEPALEASELVVHYQLAEVTDELVAFSLRLELSDNEAAWAASSADALSHWDSHARRLQKLRKKRNGLTCRRPPCRDQEESVPNATDFDSRVYLVDVMSLPGGQRNVSSVELSSMKTAYPPLFSSFEGILSRVGTGVAVPLNYSRAVCAPPLRLRLHAVNETFPTLQSIHISLHSASGHAKMLGIDGIQLIGTKEQAEIEMGELEELEVEEEEEEEEEEEDAGDEGGDSNDDAGGDDSGSEYEMPEAEIPVGEIASVTGIAATAAASSDFVRSNVKPEEFAADQAKESTKKEAQLQRSGAEAAIRKLLATPLLEVDVGEALEIIDEAEAQHVLESLIDKAVEHTERAAQLQFAGSGDESNLSAAAIM